MTTKKNNKENETTNESELNIVVARFSFGLLVSIIFVIYFIM